MIFEGVMGEKRKENGNRVAGCSMRRRMPQKLCLQKDEQTQIN